MKSRAILLALTATLISTAAAQAHVTFEVPKAKVNSYYKAVMRVSHGCEGEPTVRMRVIIPEGIIAVKPMPKAGWKLETRIGDYAHSYRLHGEEIKAGVKEIVWAGRLEDGHFDEFIFRARMTDTLPVGQTLFVPAVQECANGNNAWVEIPASGQDPHDLKKPAPGLKILASSNSHDHSHFASSSDAIHIGDLLIKAPIIRATPPNAPVSAGYMVIKNTGTKIDRLLSVSADFAKKVEVHNMEMQGDVMKMRKVTGGLEIPAGGEVRLQPGGLHVMFMGISEQMKFGETRKVTLQFEKAGEVEFEVPVKEIQPGHRKMDHSDHGMSD